jgi:hypothetical protein
MTVTQLADRRSARLGNMLKEGGLLSAERWEDQARCLGLSPTAIDALFFPKNHQSSKATRRLCDPCPVRAQCIEKGRGEYAGLWGGQPALEHAEAA